MSTAPGNSHESAGAARKADFEAVRPNTGRCITCGLEPTAGQTLNAVLLELPQGTNGQTSFQRLDYCTDCWAGAPWQQSERLLDEGQSAYPADFYGASPVAMWTARVAPKDKPKRAFVDDSVLVNFFVRLADKEELEHRRFRFVLMLILMRHRKLRHERTERAEQGDAWMVRVSPAMAESLGLPAEQVHRVVDPQMDDSQVHEVAQQLSQILNEDLEDSAPGETT